MRVERLDGHQGMTRFKPMRKYKALQIHSTETLFVRHQRPLSAKFHRSSSDFIAKSTSTLKACCFCSTATDFHLHAKNVRKSDFN